MAKSHNEEPHDHRLENDSCPGVSMIRNPGIYTSISNTLLLSFETSSLSFCDGKKEAPIYYVIPPSSPSYTLVFLI